MKCCYYKKVTILELCHFCVIAVFFFLTSCRLSYVPSGVYVPMHEKKGELYSQASLGNNGLSGQVSYAVLNNYSVTAGGQILRDDLLNHYSYEGGIGFFEPTDNRLIFETFAGGGYGYTEKPPGESATSVATHGHYYKAYLQPSTGIKSDRWETSLSLRVSYVDYKSYFVPPAHNFQRMFFEPALTAKYGWPSFKVYIQAGGSIALGKLPAELDFYPAFLNIGVQYQYKPGK